MRVGFDTETDRSWNLRTIQLYYPPPTNLIEVYLFQPGEYADTDLVTKFLVFEPEFDKIHQDTVKWTVANLKSILLGLEMVPHHGAFDHFIILRNLGISVKIAADSFLLSLFVPFTRDISRSLDSLMKIYVDKFYEKKYQGSAIEIVYPVDSSVTIKKYGKLYTVAPESLSPGDIVMGEDGAGRAVEKIGISGIGSWIVDLSPILASWEDFDWSLPIIPDPALIYAARDSRASFILEQTLAKRYPKKVDQSYSLEVSLLKVLSHAKLATVEIPEAAVATQKLAYTARLQEITDELSTAASRPLNLNFTTHVSLFLYRDLGLPVSGYTERGYPTTRRQDLVFSGNYYAGLIASHRETKSKLKYLEEMCGKEWNVTHDGTMRILQDFDCNRSGFGAYLRTMTPDMEGYGLDLAKHFASQNGGFTILDVKYLSFQLLYKNLKRLRPEQENPLEDCQTVPQLLEAFQNGHSAEFPIHKFLTGYLSGRDQYDFFPTTPKGTLEGLTSSYAEFLGRFPGLELIREIIHKVVAKYGIIKTPTERVFRINDSHHPDEVMSMWARSQGFQVYVNSTLGEIVKLLAILILKELKAPPLVTLRTGLVYDGFLQETAISPILEKVLGPYGLDSYNYLRITHQKIFNPGEFS